MATDLPIEWKLIAEEHAKLVRRTCKPGSNIEINDARAHLIHMVLGIAGEAGELVDAIKKCVIYDKILDIQNVIEELGDLEWYMEGLRQGLGLTREQVLTYNINKLNMRYPSTYSNAAAQERADKK